MAATLKKMFAALFLMAVALSGARVSAQTHHVVGGWGPDSDVSSWLSGRVFRVGDKIWFKTQESIVELKDLESLESCDLTNPIRMYTDSVSPVELENEGARYFTSADPDRCKNGLKLPVSVEPFPGSEPSPPLDPHPSHGPPPHVDPPHKYGPPPPHVEPPHMYGPPPPHVEPPHKYGPPPPPPYHPAFEPPPPPAEPKPAHVPPPPPPAEPKPAHVPPPPPPAEPKPAHVPPPPPPTEPKPARVPPPPPPPPPPPSGAAHLSGLSLVLLAGLLLCHIGM